MEIKFAQNLSELRKQNNLSQQDLANALHTTQRRISYLESGKVEPDLAMLLAISEYFDVSIDYLVGKNNY